MSHPHHSASISRRPHLNGTAQNLYIPSLYDGTLLESVLIVPTRLAHPRKAAVFAHPYGPLGGTLHDPAVQHFAAALVARGFVVAIFNFRGAGHSKGRTSWTGRPEADDYASVAAWLASFARALPADAPVAELHLLLGGYSYGALIAAQCPPAARLLQLVDRPPTAAFGTALAAGTRSARCWYASHTDAGRTSYSGVRSPVPAPVTPGSPTSMPLLALPPAASLPPAVDLAALRVYTSHLLLSPPLPPIASLLLLSWNARQSDGVMEPAVALERRGRVLVAWGDVDGFTGVRRYRRWSAKMGAAVGQGFEGVEVPGTGHFWGREALAVVDEAVDKWLK